MSRVEYKMFVSIKIYEYILILKGNIPISTNFEIYISELTLYSSK